MTELIGEEMSTILRQKYLLHHIPLKFMDLQDESLVYIYGHLLSTYDDVNKIPSTDHQVNFKYECSAKNLKHIVKCLRPLELSYLAAKPKDLLDKTKATRILFALHDKISSKYGKNIAQRVRVVIKKEDLLSKTNQRKNVAFQKQDLNSAPTSESQERDPVVKQESWLSSQREEDSLVPPPLPEFVPAKIIPGSLVLGWQIPRTPLKEDQPRKTHPRLDLPLASLPPPPLFEDSPNHLKIDQKEDSLTKSSAFLLTPPSEFADPNMEVECSKEVDNHKRRTYCVSRVYASPDDLKHITPENDQSRYLSVLSSPLNDLSLYSPDSADCSTTDSDSKAIPFNSNKGSTSTENSFIDSEPKNSCPADTATNTPVTNDQHSSCVVVADPSGEQMPTLSPDTRNRRRTYALPKPSLPHIHTTKPINNCESINDDKRRTYCLSKPPTSTFSVEEEEEKHSSASTTSTNEGEEPSENYLDTENINDETLPLSYIDSLKRLSTDLNCSQGVIPKGRELARTPPNLNLSTLDITSDAQLDSSPITRPTDIDSPPSHYSKQTFAKYNPKTKNSIKQFVNEFPNKFSLVTSPLVFDNSLSIFASRKKKSEFRAKKDEMENENKTVECIENGAEKVKVKKEKTLIVGRRDKKNLEYNEPVLSDTADLPTESEVNENDKTFDLDNEDEPKLKRQDAKINVLENKSENENYEKDIGEVESKTKLKKVTKTTGKKGKSDNNNFDSPLNQEENERKSNKLGDDTKIGHEIISDLHPEGPKDGITRSTRTRKQHSGDENSNIKESDKEGRKGRSKKQNYFLDENTKEEIIENTKSKTQSVTEEVSREHSKQTSTKMTSTEQREDCFVEKTKSGKERLTRGNSLNDVKPLPKTKNKLLPTKNQKETLHGNDFLHIESKYNLDTSQTKIKDESKQIHIESETNLKTLKNILKKSNSMVVCENGERREGEIEGSRDERVKGDIQRQTKEDTGVTRNEHLECGAKLITERKQRTKNTKSNEQIENLILIDHETENDRINKKEKISVKQTNKDVNNKTMESKIETNNLKDYKMMKELKQSGNICKEINVNICSSEPRSVFSRENGVHDTMNAICKGRETEIKSEPEEDVSKSQRTKPTTVTKKEIFYYNTRGKIESQNLNVIKEESDKIEMNDKGNANKLSKKETKTQKRKDVQNEIISPKSKKLVPIFNLKLSTQKKRANKLREELLQPLPEEKEPVSRLESKPEMKKKMTTGKFTSDVSNVTNKKKATKQSQPEQTNVSRPSRRCKTNARSAIFEMFNGST